jgi:hypothetical protein
MKHIIVAVIFGATSALAQTSIGFYTGMSHRGNDYNSYTSFSPRSWHKGITVGLQGEFGLLKNLAVRGTIEYNQYKFHRYFDIGWPPYFRVGASRGDDAECARVAVEGVYALQLSRYFTPLFFTGIGYAEERNGAIWYTLVHDDGTETEHHIPKRFKPFLFHSLGLGIRTFPTSNFGFELAGKMINDYATRYHHAINLSVLIKLN